MVITTPLSDPAWLDAQYNNRARVANFATHLRRWAEDSDEALRTQPRVVDVRYGGGPNEHLDVFPAPEGDAPVLVFIHGGYWRSLDKRDHAFIAPAFTSEGACVVVPNYALAPAVTVPQIAMQMVAALAWTWRHIAKHGGDRQRITVVGHSAGGHLASLLLTCLWPVYHPDLPSDLVKRALAISPVHDLDPVMRAPYLQESLHLTPQQVAQASPARLPAPPGGVLYSVVGGDESDEFLRQNQLIRQAWGPARVPVCETLPGLDHFSILQALAQPGHRLNSLALELLRQ